MKRKYSETTCWGKWTIKKNKGIIYNITGVSIIIDMKYKYIDIKLISICYGSKFQDKKFPSLAMQSVCECGNMVFLGTVLWIFLHSTGHRWPAEEADILQPVTYPQDTSQQADLSLPELCVRNLNVLITADKRKQGVHWESLTLGSVSYHCSDWSAT